jgi:hypothetical protein
LVWEYPLLPAAAAEFPATAAIGAAEDDPFFHGDDEFLFLRKWMRQESGCDQDRFPFQESAQHQGQVAIGIQHVFDCHLCFRSPIGKRFANSCARSYRDEGKFIKPMNLLVGI